MGALYQEAYIHGTLASASASLFEAMRNCTLCPRECAVNRLESETGTCNTGDNAMVSSYGPHRTDADGIAVRGLLVRHLVMPGDRAGTGAILDFLVQEISPDTAVNIMSQYHPCGSVIPGSTLDRAITVEEFHSARAMAKEKGLKRLL